MKVGDLVRHRNTREVGLLVAIPRRDDYGVPVGSVRVMTRAGPGSWWHEMCAVISESK
jgi:hypothetical protein